MTQNELMQLNDQLREVNVLINIKNLQIEEINDSLKKMNKTEKIYHLEKQLKIIKQKATALHDALSLDEVSYELNSFLLELASIDLYEEYYEE